MLLDQESLDYSKFKEKGYDFFVGVPCSQLKGFIRDIIADKEVRYIPAPREDVAMAMAVGAYMTGKKPLVYLQSSGLGHLVNIIASLLKPYGISIHLLISVRTRPFQHFFMYKITSPLLRLLEYDNFTLIKGDQ